MANRDDGEFTHSVTRPTGSTAKLQLREWTVEVLSGPDKGKKATTLGDLVRIGAETTNDLVLTDTTVSRRHGEVLRTPDGLLIRDLGSRNGTTIDGRRVVAAYVKPGDEFSVGKTKLLLKQTSKKTDVPLSLTEVFGEMVGSSDSMRAVFAELRRLSAESVNLLIEGETGTGKELAARAVHAHSPHKKGPFRVVDCALVTPENAERELFGPDGAFLSAEGGTIFFDEVSELPASVQPKLLRVLESRELPAVGNSKARPISVRVVASTHHNLDEEVRAERFRGDLFYRLAVARVRLPPLRARLGDLPILTQFILSKLGVKLTLSPDALSLLDQYDWPGNVRELRNILERAALLQETGSSSWLNLNLLPNPPQKRTPKAPAAVMAALQYHEAKDRVVADFEREYFTEVMKNTSFDIKLAEQKTGLSMQSLYRLLKKNGLRIRDLKNADGLED